MEYSYPILDKVIDLYGPRLKGNKLPPMVACQHIMEPQLRMFELLIKVGFDPGSISLIGKAYSTNEGVLSKIRSLGIEVKQPIFRDIDFDLQHHQNCKNLLDTFSDNEFLILDDGGELISVASNNNLNVLHAVEQTSSGFRKLENEKPPFPIINVARSKTKLTQESLLVARHAYERILKYTTSKNIENPKVLMIGLGPIGFATLQIFQENSFATEGFDMELSKSDLIKYLIEEKPDLVIGATGNRLFEKEDLKNLISEHPYYFLSLSSADREFPVSDFRGTETIHEDVVYNNFTFVNNGFPITFRGNPFELTPQEIEKTIALLMGSVLYGVDNYSNLRKGFVEVPEELEELINN